MSGEFFPGAFCAFRDNNIREFFGNVTGQGVKVAVVDSGWDLTINDSRIQKGIGLVDSDSELDLKKSEFYGDQNGHGTACTELILRIAPDTQIYPVKVFGKRIETSVNILIESIYWCIDNKIKIINLSLGTLLDFALELLYKACEDARRNGIIIVSAKSNSSEWSYPSIFENSIGVGSASFSSIFDFNYREEEAIECLARGRYDDLFYLHGKRVKSRGNSFAAPVITGIIALLAERDPSLSLEKARELLNKFDSIERSD